MSKSKVNLKENMNLKKNVTLKENINLKQKINLKEKSESTKKIYFITGNKNKFLEVKEFLSGVADVEMISVDVPEIQEFDSQKIVEKKLKEAQKILKEKDFIIEDTSLYLKCLNGFPGPLIKWFEKTLGYQKIYDLCNALKNNEAEAKVIIGYSSNKKIYFFEGSSKGRIVQPGYSQGFGWDLIYMPEGFNLRYSELSVEQKNKISHRAKALEKFKYFLKKQQLQE